MDKDLYTDSYLWTGIKTTKPELGQLSTSSIDEEQEEADKPGMAAGFWGS